MSASGTPPENQRLTRQTDGPGTCTSFSIRALAAVGGIGELALHTL